MGAVPRLDPCPQDIDQLVEAHQRRTRLARLAAGPPVAGKRRQQRPVNRLPGRLHLALAERRVGGSGIEDHAQAAARLPERVGQEIGAPVDPQADRDAAPRLGVRHRGRGAERRQDRPRMRPRGKRPARHHPRERLHEQRQPRSQRPLEPLRPHVDVQLLVVRLPQVIATLGLPAKVASNSRRAFSPDRSPARCPGVNTSAMPS